MQTFYKIFRHALIDRNFESTLYSMINKRKILTLLPTKILLISKIDASILIIIVIK